MNRFRTVALGLSLLPAACFAQELIGTHQSRVPVGGSVEEYTLRCEKETACDFTSVVREAGRVSLNETQPLQRVAPVEQPLEAINALRYAADRRSAPIQHEEYAELMKQLRPLLESGAKISQCWDLNYPEPGYMLACSVDKEPWNRSSLLLFGTLLATCGEAFCRYVITPMQRVP